MMIVQKVLDNGFDDLINSIRYTPDWMRLRKSKNDEFLVFVYDDHRYGKSRSKFLEGCNFYGRAITFNDNFILKKDEDKKTMAFRMESDDWKLLGYNTLKVTEMRHIEGEVYGVPLRALAELDRRCDNTQGNDRVKTEIIFLDPIQGMDTAEAFMYIIDNEFFSDFQGYYKLFGCNFVELRLDKSTPESAVEAYYG